MEWEIGIKSLKWEGIGTKNLFPHISKGNCETWNQMESARKQSMVSHWRLNTGI